MLGDSLQKRFPEVDKYLKDLWPWLRDTMPLAGMPIEEMIEDSLRGAVYTEPMPEELARFPLAADEFETVKPEQIKWDGGRYIGGIRKSTE